MDEIVGRIMLIKLLSDLLSVILGTGLLFGALKWSKGLISTTALYWGAFIGTIIGYLAFLDNIEFFLYSIIICALILPILTYTIAGVNRFILGFIVTTKIMYLITVPMFKDGNIDLPLAIFIPLLIGTFAGLFFMSWTKVKISTFIYACAFLGASEIAPVAADYVNQFFYGFTGLSWFMYNPLDFVFAIMKIQLTDWTTFILMMLLMAIGIYTQFKSVTAQLKAKGYENPLEVPLITYETANRERHGKID